MKNIRIIVIALITLALANSAFSQTKFFGEVTEIIDGRTVIIEPQPRVKIRLQLQYIEVPEPEQQLHDTVREHLEKLLLGKRIEFKPKSINVKSNPVGQILLNDVDISQQMLRDGAAWYSESEKNSQSEAERKIYQDNQNLARIEKRGVWSIPDLKPAWVFRAEKEEKRKQDEWAKLEIAKNKAIEQQRESDSANSTVVNNVNNTGNIWADVYGYDFLKKKIPDDFTDAFSWNIVKKQKSNADPITGFDETLGWGYVATPITKLTMLQGRKTFDIYAVMINFYENKDNKINNYYVLRFYSQSKNEILSMNQELNMVLHQYKVKLKPIDRVMEKRNGNNREMLEFGLPPKLIDIMRSHSIQEMRLGEYETGMSYFYTRIYTLLAR